MDPSAGKMPWRRERLPTPIFLPGEFHGQRTLEGPLHGVAKSRKQLRDVALKPVKCSDYYFYLTDEDIEVQRSQDSLPKILQLVKTQA